MDEKSILVGQYKSSDLIETALTNLKQTSKGSIICLAAEAGYGKSHILDYYYRQCRKDTDFNTSLTACEAPVGRISAANILPLLPFTRSMEQLLAKKEMSAEKKLALNVGLTTLASVPLLGEVFYAVKELSKDWKQYRKEKNVNDKKVSSGATEYFDSICALAEKQPLVMFFDDLHWGDAQSIELLSLLADNIEKIRVVVVFSYRQSIVESKASPLFSFFLATAQNTSVVKTELETFSLPDIKALANVYLIDKKPDEKLLSWLFARSFGVANSVMEYISFFKKNPQYMENGEYERRFGKSEIVSSGESMAMSRVLTSLTFEDINILCICSAEGRQFTALIVSALLNTDVLSTIKKLRTIQREYGIIRSLGAHNRYGQRTTLYEFSQSAYHIYFRNLLEFEESEALHARIADILKDKFDKAESDFIRSQIAPYLAAHSAESGDSDTAKSMLLYAAKSANYYGAEEVINEAYNCYQRLNIQNAEGSNSPNNAFETEFSNIRRSIAFSSNASAESNGSGGDYSGSSSSASFINFRNSLVDMYHQGNFEKTAADAAAFYESARYTSKENFDEQLQSLAFAIKSYSESGNFAKAEEYALIANKIFEQSKDSVSECLALNAIGLFEDMRGNFVEAQIRLEEAARLSMSLPPELKLLTITNIAHILKKRSSKDSKNYMSIVRKLSASLNFHTFADEAMLS